MTLDLPKKLQALVNLARHQKGTRETARLALDCLDYTSLSGDETISDIHELCDIARHNRVASVCVPPRYVAVAKQALKGCDVTIATVGNFDDGIHRSFSKEPATPETIKEDVKKAIADGATQFDLVFPRHDFGKGDYLKVKEKLRACRISCAEGIKMKVIFETAAFDTSRDLRAACHLAIGQQADCLKTSTGKHPLGGATLEAAAILLDEAQKAPYPVGVKISGGVRSNNDCASYITLARGIRGHNSISREFFRIGASSLLDQLIPILGNKVQPNSPEPSRY